MLIQVFNHEENVVQAARRRIAWLLDRFGDGKVIVAISGGKDSTVLAHLALEEARRRGWRIGLFFLDEEVVYQSTIDQVEYLMTLYPENVIPLWLQLEFRLTNSTSSTEGQLIAWEAGKHKLWMRPKRKNSIQQPPWDRATQTVRDRRKGFGFYDAIENFERCYSDTAFLVGLRAIGEGPNRWRAVTKHPVDVDGERIFWGTRRGGSVVSFYPIYDWMDHDIWRYLAEHGVRYSRIYDYQFLKGYPLHRMRVSSLIHEHSYHAIADLPEFEPKTYAKLLKRIKGIALAQETAKSAQLFRCSKLPQNFRSWLTYRDHLLATHPDPKGKAIFEARFAKHLPNEYVARQQCRQLVMGDIENLLLVDNKPDPRDVLIALYEEVL